ncbi:MAG: acetolactate synthase [Verrucomicrobiales bacterium]|nr:acetolactate synthase [Verrucomicrobiales bacterium]
MAVGYKAQTTQARTAESVIQFSIFTPNRLGHLNELITLFGTKGVHVLALTVLDTTDSSIIRLVVDDPDAARRLLEDGGFAYSESHLLVVELESATELTDVISALLETELNINYLYSFIPHPGGKSLLALSMEDNEMGEKVLKARQFRVLRQCDISR